MSENAPFDDLVLVTESGNLFVLEYEQAATVK